MSNDVGARAPRPHRGWHRRGYLPHFDAGAAVQTITFRLADSLPREFYERAAAASNDVERFLILEKGIDQGRGGCLLADRTNAAIMRNALEHFDGGQYLLLAWVIMPNHVHAMIEQIDGYSLTNVVQAWKSVSAHAINKARGTNGRIWSPDYFDRFIRNEEHYIRAKYYIENNPVKARLAKKPEDWPYSSAVEQRDDAGGAPALRRDRFSEIHTECIMPNAEMIIPAIANAKPIVADTTAQARKRIGDVERDSNIIGRERYALSRISASSSTILRLSKKLIADTATQTTIEKTDTIQIFP